MKKNLHRGIYAGSFDPLTLGHMNIIERASLLFDELIVAVAKTIHKQPLFSIEARVEMAQQAVAPLNNVRVKTFHGLLVDFARAEQAQALVRGLRSVKDFEYEFQMALTNKTLNPELETVFLMTEGRYAHVASSLIREIVMMGGNCAGMVPEHVNARLKTLPV